MAYNYYYIDDMPEKVQGLVVGLNKKDILEVIFFEPKGNWEDEMHALQLARSENKFQGLILDLRLQDEPNKDNKISRYRGSSIAQEIRIRVKEGAFADCPIVLLSASDNLRASLDPTSKDLFDLIIEKDFLGDSFSYEKAQQVLIALAQGYDNLLRKPELRDLLQVDLTLLDQRLINEIALLYGAKPAHILAGFIIKQLLQRSGPLVNIRLVSARLGIDLSASEDRDEFMKLIMPFQYKGLFSEGWQRWWFHSIEKWWAENFPDKILRLLKASERAELISQKFNLKLTAYNKTPRSKSEKFWAICKGTSNPIDPTDGFVIADQDNLYPWQDKEYVSIDEALERKYIAVWRSIASMEKSKYDKLIKSIGADGSNRK